MNRTSRVFDPHSIATQATIRRRSLMAGALGVGSAFLLSACQNEANQAAPSASDPAGTGTAGGSSPFPVELTHKFGTTVVPATPERIASVGLTEHDAILALGYQPVAVTEWFGDYPFATWPWAQDLLKSEPEVLSYADGVQIERVAQAAPDLILGINAGLNKGTYNKLSKLAPVIAQSGQYTDYFEPWRVQSTALGKALGKDAEMQELMTNVDEVYAAARADHPEFEGKNVFLMAPAFYDGSIYVYQEGISTEFLTALGLAFPDVIGEYATDDATAFIPKEDLVDALEVGDVVIWLTTSDEERHALEDDPIVQRLRSTEENRNIFTGLEIGGAVNFSTVLSLPWLADQLVPQLADVLGG
jgi:iron complex transport system substrate-binding protein